MGAWLAIKAAFASRKAVFVIGFIVLVLSVVAYIYNTGKDAGEQAVVDRIERDREAAREERKEIDDEVDGLGVDDLIDRASDWLR